jgi:hypothetical protein
MLRESPERFFLRAAKEAQIPIGPALGRLIKPRSQSPHLDQTAIQPTKIPSSVLTPSQQAATSQGVKVSSLVLDALDFTTLSRAQQAAVFTTVQLLKMRGQ